MSAKQESLTEWITKLNDTLFIQPNDEIAIKAIDEQVDPSLITKINHNVYTYDQFKGGLLYVRGSTTAIQDEFSEILTWEDPEKGDGVVAVLSKWRTKHKETGEEAKKTNVILWEVKLIDGKRKLTGQTEVEVN
ncbi:hypothetical protein BKA60DRAFT_255536 [Fusarium oxysporum]|uniref:Uncharacterized protein n=1 Tax=Fusarium oxysporum TaxID=5507 RepID=A0A420N931_FUSOX|nr:hypothetical protein FOXYS1_2434 [Fusarium oxysporum]KAH7225179.1 hypothetical protein BKA60DRAFT_255536 [Fusarium oxysporum]RKK76776.1 hypothetical protein BFJ69_g6725 [Fusarium oxysporum]